MAYHVLVTTSGEFMPVAHPMELAETDMFDLWTTAPALAKRFDAASFEHRMVAYRTLIDATNHNGLFGPDNRGNPLWGLMFQTQWQFRSGRLGSESRTDGRIDPDAAWGYGNYSVNVIPWLAAAQTGIVANVDIVGPSKPSRFRYASGGGTQSLWVPEEFAAGVDDWRRYFELVAATGPDADQEPLRMALWRAHKTCLEVVVTRIANIDPAPYSADELTFLRGWCRMVLYLGAAAWRTDFDHTTKYGLDVLPEQLLPETKDLPAQVRRNVRNVVALARTPKLRNNFNLWLWRRIMRTRQARDEVVTMLDAMFNPNPGNAADRRRMLGYMLRP